MGNYGGFGSSLRDLPRLRSSRSRRTSSWDQTGGNDDRLTMEPGETATLVDVIGAGCVNHIWITAAHDKMERTPDALEPDFLRKVLLRMYWDGEEEPSVIVPLGDFFGVGHARPANFASLPIQMSPKDGKSFNCFFHMPFANGARIEAVSEMEHERVFLYYYIDYEEYDELEEGLGRFHAQWRRQNPTDGVPEDEQSNETFLFSGENIGGEGNYVILDAQGRGHYVGCVLNVHNLRDTHKWNWYGEGDDMIFIDGEEWPPTLHGTGTEDYFNTAWGPQQEYSAPYHGITLGGGDNWSGQISLYRFHVEDPITFERSIRVTIEHGHANKRSVTTTPRSPIGTSRSPTSRSRSHQLTNVYRVPGSHVRSCPSPREVGQDVKRGALYSRLQTYEASETSMRVGYPGVQAPGFWLEVRPAWARCTYKPI